MRQLTKAGQRRREFLGGVVAGSAATALLAVGAVAESESETGTAAASKHKPEGYHVTAHIRTYYEKAQF